MGNLLIDNLYERVLVEPVKKVSGLDNLLIVSGYATSAMAFHHLNEMQNIQVGLIYGMSVLDGIDYSNHKGFCKLVNDDFNSRFDCSYIYKGIPVHSKLYIWCVGNDPKLSFIGSANYTQAALMRKKRREIVTSCDAEKSFDYYQSLVGDSINCTHNDVSEYLCLYTGNKQKTEIQKGSAVPAVDYTGLEHAKTSLVTRSGETGDRSGLNWGQRPEEGRDPNQAYLSLPAPVYKSDFFPLRGVHFTVRTDDGKVFVCSRAQDNSKAIHTPHNNSLLGEYFRHRLGLQGGEYVTATHLRTYGRTDIDFYKIDAETYYLDFSI